MEILKKIFLLNRNTLESFSESRKQKIVERFTKAGMKIFGADFGFSYWKEDKDKKYKLIYKTPGLNFEPRLPRKYGYASQVEKRRQPYLNRVKREKISKFDFSRHMRSIIIIPIVYKQWQYGTIVLGFKTSKTFIEEDTGFSIALGNAAAQAITINRLHSRVKNERNNLESKVRERTEQLHRMYDDLAKDQVMDDAILSNIGEGLIVTDQRGKISLINPQALEMLGWDHQELINRSLYEILPMFDQEGKKLEPQELPTYLAMAENRRISSGQMSYPNKNGQLVPLFLTATPIRLEGQIIGAIQVFRDITKEREIDHAKSELISLVSHQLRTPLSGINWYAEALLKEEVGRLGQRQKQYLQEVYKANQKLVELVYDFLNVSRIELGTFNLKLSSIDLPELAKGILAELAPMVKEKRLRITQRYLGRLRHIEADRKVVRLILQNLITNAVKYTNPRGKILISAEEKVSGGKQRKLAITVKDDGVGIPEKDREKIFSKLFRSENIKSLDANGTGLGLYIVRSFVRLCGGEIWFLSKEGKGSSFHVNLPLPDRQLPAKSQNSKRHVA